MEITSISCGGTGGSLIKDFWQHYKRRIVSSLCVLANLIDMSSSEGQQSVFNIVQIKNLGGMIRNMAHDYAAQALKVIKTKYSSTQGDQL